MERVVVTGGAGFVGSHVVRAFLDAGYDTHSVDSYVAGKKAERMHASATYHEHDIADTKALEEIFTGATIVCHTAAIPRVPYSVAHPVESTHANITGTASVLTAAMRSRVSRVVFSSSGSVYGEQQKLPLSEEMVPQPVNPYALQKLVGEWYMRMWARSYGVQTVSLRYFNVYGPGLDPSGPYALAVGAFLLARKEGRPLTIFGDGTITRDYTHVHDVARANVLAATSPRVGLGECINIGTSTNHTIQSLAEMIGGEIVYAAPRLEAHDSRADNRRAKELLDWEPTITLAEGIAALKKEWGI